MTSRTEAPATVEALTGISGGRSHLNDFEQFAALAGLAWLGVAIAGVWETAHEAWPYFLFSITLMLAAVLSVAVRTHSIFANRNTLRLEVRIRRGRRESRCRPQDESNRPNR